MPDGSVRGEFVQHVTALDRTVRKHQSEIDCMHFLAPNDGVLSGVVKVNLNPAIVGQTQIFRMVDNGEGAGSADAQSPVFFRQTLHGPRLPQLRPESRHADRGREHSGQAVGRLPRSSIATTT